MRHGQFHVPCRGPNRDWRRRGRFAARPHQYDAGRLAEPLAAADAASRIAAIRRHRRYHVHAVDHGEVATRSAMVVLNKIYTRTGDDGTTALGTGGRRKKYDLRIAAYGTVDEANAAIGIARLHAAGNTALDAALARIQNDLFDLGADLCTPGRGKGPGGARLTVTENQVAWLEAEIDRLNAELKDKAGESVTPEVLKYLNRLSDYLFVASRYANGKGADDVLWKPGENR